MPTKHLLFTLALTSALSAEFSQAFAQTPEAPAAPAAPAATPVEAAPAPSANASVTEASSAEEAEPDPYRAAAREVGPNVSFRPGRGLRLASEDGQFELTLRLRGQLLYTYEQANDAPAGEHALELRRARLTFSGHWWGEHNRYKVEFAVAPRDEGMRDNITASSPSTSEVLDWYMEFTHLRDLSVRVGQYKVNFNRERVMSSGDMPLVDRSIVNGEFNLDRDVGVELYSRNFLGLDFLRYTAGLYIGRGRNSVGFHERNRFMALGRVEIHPLGTFEDLQLVDFARSEEPRLAIGLAAGYISHAHRNLGILGTSTAGVVPDGVDLKTRHFAADALFQYRGLSLSGEFLLRDGVQSGTPTDPAVVWGDPRNGWGTYGEVGYLLPSVNLSVNARYGALRRFGHVRNDTVASSLGGRNELGGGFTYFFARHAYKIQADYFYLWAEGDRAAGDHRIRAQLQISL